MVETETNSKRCCISRLQSSCAGESVIASFLLMYFILHINTYHSFLWPSGNRFEHCSMTRTSGENGFANINDFCLSSLIVYLKNCYNRMVVWYRIKYSLIRKHSRDLWKFSLYGSFATSFGWCLLDFVESCTLYSSIWRTNAFHSFSIGFMLGD